MQPGQRRRTPMIKRGSFAEVIRAYMHSPKFDGLARSTRVSYGYLLRLAERPETLGGLCLTSFALRWSRLSLTDFDPPAQQKCAQTALKAVESGARTRSVALPNHDWHRSSGLNRRL